MNEWKASEDELRRSDNRMALLIEEALAWPTLLSTVNTIAVVHTAYYLGNMRQMLCTVSLVASGEH